MIEQVKSVDFNTRKANFVEKSPAQFIEDALSPARILSVTIEKSDDESIHRSVVAVAPDQQSLAIGKGGQNVRLAAKLTGWRIDIKSVPADQVAEYTDESDETDGE